MKMKLTPEQKQKHEEALEMIRARKKDIRDSQDRLETYLEYFCYGTIFVSITAALFFG